MDYPNKNLQLVMQRDAERMRRDHDLFGDTLNLMTPDKHLGMKYAFKRYSASVTNMFDRQP